jgi:hypothetical protein
MPQKSCNFYRSLEEDKKMPEFLVNIWNWLAGFYNANPMSGPIVSYLVFTLAGKLGNAGLIILEIRRSIKDGLVDDQEIACIAWRIISVFYGLWPNESKRVILKYAPPHQRKIILGEKG